MRKRTDSVGISPYPNMPRAVENLFHELEYAVAPFKSLFRSQPDLLEKWNLIEDYPNFEYQRFEDEDLVYVDVPGIPKNEVHVKLLGEKILVSAEHETCFKNLHPSKSEEKTTASGPLCVHRKYDKCFRIPSDIDKQYIRTYYKDGIVVIRLPRIHALRKDLPISFFPESLKDQIKDKFGFSG